ncbi:hypothetical protein MNB_SM-7-364 [hydrothermal vent metagenome]|uniref:Lipoprotein n=1 Tax=hydrothermal vent metagenome TaxID=652676 RepID=A0A1W1BRL5_9ZZZZ
MKKVAAFSISLLVAGLIISCGDSNNSQREESKESTTSTTQKIYIDDINITLLPNSTKRIDTGISQDNKVEISTPPSHGSAEAFLVANESWNIDYHASCYIGKDSFIYKKNSNEYGRVNITIKGANTLNEENKTVSTKENIPLRGIFLSSTTPLSLKTNTSHGKLYPYYSEANISKFDYYPDRNFHGVDFFDYEVNQSINGCDISSSRRVTINVEAEPSYKVPVVFPDNNAQCRVALTDGNNSLIYSSDVLIGDYCINYPINFHKVLDRFEYVIDPNTLHAISEDASISDLNRYQRETLKTSTLYDWDGYRAGTKDNAYVFRYQYYKNITGAPVMHYTENLIYSAYTPVRNENEDIEEMIFGKLPWSDRSDHEALFDIVGDRISADKVITSYAGIDNNIYFVGYDGANGNGISLACVELVDGSPSFDGKCQGIQLYLNKFDDYATDTGLDISSSDIVSILNKTLVFSYTHNYAFDDNEITQHIKLISDGQYYRIFLQKAKVGYTLFYKGKNRDTNKTEIGYIKEENNSLKSRYYLMPDRGSALTQCASGTNDDSCSKSLTESRFILQKLYEFQERTTPSKWLVYDDEHIYFSERNTTLNADMLKVLNRKSGSITSLNIDLLNTNGARVDELKLIGNYIYLLTSSTSTDYPISLWKIDPKENSIIKVEGYETNKYIKLFKNSLNEGNTIIYTTMNINDDQTQYTDFKLYSYDALKNKKHLITTANSLNIQ